MRNVVTKKMNLIRATVTQDINNTFRKGAHASTQAFAIATMALHDTVTFVTQLLVFIDSTLHDKLHVDSTFTDVQSWALTMQVLDRICEDLYTLKEGVLEAMTIGDP